MKEYRVLMLDAAPDWAAVPPAVVDVCPWGGEYRPTVWGQAAFVPGDGLYVRMSCVEQAPRAVYTAPDDPVCRDSCLEFFCDMSPDGLAGYLNIEANANGAALYGFGKGRHGRTPLRRMDCELPSLTAFRTGAVWGWQARISMATIRALWGETALSAGCFWANMYKCGDDTETPHYCVWNPITAEKPDYHRPECFGRMLLG